MKSFLYACFAASLLISLPAIAQDTDTAPTSEEASLSGDEEGDPIETPASAESVDKISVKELKVENLNVSKEVKTQEEPKAKDTVDVKGDLRAGKFIKWGFTGGVGLAMHMPGPGRTHALSHEIGVSPLPYAAILPARWFIRGNITREYCARWWGTASRKSAQKTADAMAVQQAKELVGMNGKFHERRWHYFKELQEEEETNSIDEYLKDPGRYPVNTFNETGWAVGVKARCWPTIVFPGIYLGVPGKFEIDAQGNRNDNIEARELRPLFSAGLILTPFNYFSLLGGVTRSNVIGDDNRTHGIWSWTVAVGGNLDIVGLLLKP